MPVRDSSSKQARKFSLWGLGVVLTVVLFVGVGMAVSAAVKAYSRAEQRYDAENQVALSHIAISRTLTANYLQHEAIRAQKAIAASGRNNMLIYVPSGANVPLVQDPQNVNRRRSATAR
jgi:flagellar basal body-associated protein FliL